MLEKGYGKARLFRLESLQGFYFVAKLFGGRYSRKETTTMNPMATLPPKKQEPAYREFTYTVMVVDDDVECIGLLTQVMQSYPTADRRSICAWFAEAYGPNSLK